MYLIHPIYDSLIIIMKRAVFYISDRTGITAEALGHSLMSQFSTLEFDPITIPYVDTPEKADELVLQINQLAKDAGTKPLVFSTIVDADIQAIIAKSNGMHLDFFNTFLQPLEKELKMKSSHTVGLTHGVVDTKSYDTRIEAVNYVLNCDDGANVQGYDQADLILVGVSRCGKTPTSLYLAMRYGLRVANYPFTEDDLEHLQLPKLLEIYRERLFGITIDAHRLQAIREERRPHSRYSSLRQCQHEIREVDKLYKREKIPNINSTALSIEEIAATILSETGLKRRLV